MNKTKKLEAETDNKAPIPEINTKPKSPAELLSQNARAIKSNEDVISNLPAYEK